MTSTPERPRQVTMAAWVVILGSVFIVFSAYDRIAALHSLEMQEAIRDFLDEPLGKGLGLSLNDARGMLRVLVLIAAACGAAGAVLGFRLLSGSSSARLALTILAAPIFIAGASVASIVAAFVTGAIVSLWWQPARNWFAGLPPVERSPDSRRAIDEVADPRPLLAPERDRPVPHERALGTAEGGAAQHTAQLPQPRPASAAPTGRGDERPGAVLGASIVTWSMAGLVVLLFGLTGLLMAASPDLLFDELRRQDPGFDTGGLSDAALARGTVVICAIGVVWSLAAIWFAVMSALGRRWGRTALLISASVAALVCLASVLASILAVIPLACCAVTVHLLLRPESAEWFRR